MDQKTSPEPNVLAAMTDRELIAIWEASVDPEHPTPKERAALDLMEARNVDF